MPGKLIAVVLAVSLCAAPAAAQQTDTAKPAAPRPPLFTGGDAWLALGLVAGTAALAPLDRNLAGALQDSSLQVHTHLRRVAAALRFLGFPGSAIIGGSLYAVGRIGDLPRVAAIGLHGTEAILLSFAIVWPIKNVAGRARPFLDTDDPFNLELLRGRRSDDFQSFPSGHTAAAFAVAAAVSEETEEIWPEATPWARAVLYSGAVLVGVSRIYHNRHWASDAAAGAAIGTFSGLKVIRYHYQRAPGNALDRWLLPRAMLPGENGSLLVVWSWSVN